MELLLNQTMKNLPGDIENYVVDHPDFIEAEELRKMGYPDQDSIETFKGFCDYMLGKILESSRRGEHSVPTQVVSDKEFFARHREWYEEFFNVLRESGYFVECLYSNFHESHTIKIYLK